MSLIDEALKRARMEAAQRAAESEGMPYPTIPRHLGPPRQRPRWLVAVALLVVAIAGIALGRWLTSGGPPEGTAIAERRAPAVPQERTAEPPTAALGGDTAAVIEPGPALDSAATPPATAAVPPVPAVRPSSDDRTPTPPPAPTAPPATPTAPPAAPTANAAPPATVPADARNSRTTTVTDPDSDVLLVLPEPEPAAAIDTGEASAAESYVQQLPLAEGGAIELGGIAWSETGPFALLNGRVVGPGAEVAGFTLESIGPRHVVLHGQDRRVRIDLR